MEPLSLKTRRIIALLFFAFFALVLAASSIYATGYRLSGFSLKRTGGIHVSTPVSNARVILNEKVIGTSGFLSKSFFIDKLDSGGYTLTVEAPGYRTWTKHLIVEPAFVSDTNAFLVPEEVVLLPVIATTSSATATTTRAVSAETYQAIARLFIPATTTPEVLDDIATSAPPATLPPEAPSAVELIIYNGNVSVRWNRDLSRAPSSFCITPRACVVEVTVENGDAEALDAAFFGDGVVYRLRGQGIFFAEVDVKQPRVVLPLFTAPSADFRIENGEIIIKDGERFFVVATF